MHGISPRPLRNPTREALPFSLTPVLEPLDKGWPREQHLFPPRTDENQAQLPSTRIFT